jgi:hypothetical protein
MQVMQGKIQVRTRSQYKAALSADDNSGAKGKSTGGSAHSSGGAADGSNRAAAASEADLRALFDSIDVDGSGMCAEACRAVLPANSTLHRDEDAHRHHHGRVCCSSTSSACLSLAQHSAAAAVLQALLLVVLALLVVAVQKLDLQSIASRAAALCG